MLDAHALTGPYVLDALPDLERAKFAKHLQSCSWCTNEVEELREAAARLSAQVTAQPPRRLKAEVMGQAARVRQLPIASGRRLRSMLALAAATLAVAGSGALALTSHHDATVAQTSTGEVAKVLAESDARTARGSVTGGGQATVVTSARRDAAVVILRELPSPPTGTTYQLWTVDTNGVARSLGLANGDEQIRVISGGVASASAFSITVEPMGGSSEPTLPVSATVALI